MRITDYAAMARGTAVRERLLMGLSAGLLLCTIAEGVALARDRRAVVIVPEGLTHEARLSASRADEPYLSSWSYYLAGLLGNVTPGTSGYIKDALGPRLAPEVYQSVISALAEQVRRITEDRVTLSFIPKYSRFEEKSGKYFVNGISVVTVSTLLTELVPPLLLGAVLGLYFSMSALNSVVFLRKSIS